MVYGNSSSNVLRTLRPARVVGDRRRSECHFDVRLSPRQRLHRSARNVSTRTCQPCEIGPDGATLRDLRNSTKPNAVRTFVGILPVVSEHRTAKQSFLEATKALASVVALTLIVLVVLWAAKRDWPTMRIFAPAYGASLLALGGFVQMVLASTAGEGERRRSKRSSWWDSLGWAAISFGGGMAAMEPVADLFAAL